MNHKPEIVYAIWTDPLTVYGDRRGILLDVFTGENAIVEATTMLNNMKLCGKNKTVRKEYAKARIGTLEDYTHACKLAGVQDLQNTRGNWHGMV